LLPGDGRTVHRTCGDFRADAGLLESIRGKNEDTPGIGSAVSRLMSGCWYIILAPSREWAVICSLCSSPYESLDNYCRHCGTAIAVEVPVVRQSIAVPAPWEQVRPAVTKSAIALVAGIALDLALRHVGRAVGGSPRAVTVRGSGARVEQPRRPVTEVTESLYIRRVTHFD
jgi:hypothetical protein